MNLNKFQKNEIDFCTQINICHYNYVDIRHSIDNLNLITTQYVISTTLRSNCQGLTLISLLIPTVDTTYCDAVLIACHETSQFILCDTASGDVQKSPIWGLGSVGGNADEVEIRTVSTTQCPAHSDIHSSTSDIFRDINTGECGDSGWTCMNVCVKILYNIILVMLIILKRSDYTNVK